MLRIIISGGYVNELRDMLDEFNPAWRDEFISIRDAAEYYGLEAMIEYHDLMHEPSYEEPYRELNFHEG